MMTQDKFFYIPAMLINLSKIQLARPIYGVKIQDPDGAGEHLTNRLEFMIDSEWHSADMENRQQLDGMLALWAEVVGAKGIAPSRTAESGNSESREAAEGRFVAFWEAYREAKEGNPGSKRDAHKAFMKLSAENQQKATDAIPFYKQMVIKDHESVKFMKQAQGYLNKQYFETAIEWASSVAKPVAPSYHKAEPQEA